MLLQVNPHVKEGLRRLIQSPGSESFRLHAGFFDARPCDAAATGGGSAPWALQLVARVTDPADTPTARAAAPVGPPASVTEPAHKLQAWQQSLRKRAGLNARSLHLIVGVAAHA